MCNIPEFNTSGNLPSGVHWTKWEVFIKRYGYSSHRIKLISGLKLGISNLKDVGCKVIYIDGSFITSKERPNDFDVCYEESDINSSLLKVKYPELIDFKNKRKSQKDKYFGEFFPMDLFDFFQRDKITNELKGIIGIKL